MRSAISKASITGIAHDSPKAAKAVVDRIFASTELLASFPYMGRAGREEGTRGMGSCRACRISWCTEVHEERGEVIVIAVFHGAQDWGNTRLKERRRCPAG